MLYGSPAHEPVHRQPEPRTPDKPKQPQGPSRARQQRSPSQPKSPHGPDSRKPSSRKPQRHRSAPAGAPQEPQQAVASWHHHPASAPLPN